MTDPDGYQKMTAEQVLNDLLGPLKEEPEPLPVPEPEMPPETQPETPSQPETQKVLEMQSQVKTEE